jgi:hypothetical protein
MADEQYTVALPEVPRQVFERFLGELRGEAEIPEELVERLRKTLLDERNLGEAAIKAALSSDSDEI